MTTNLRRRLQDALERLRTTPFPEDSGTSEQLSELHAELAEYDGHVAGVASSVLGGSQVERGLLQQDRTLRSRLALLAANAENPVRYEARQHLDYCGRLDELLHIAQELVGR
jgi:hypothetical protein